MELKVDDKEFENFRVLKLFPLSQPNKFVTFYEVDKDEVARLRDEIGVLKNFRKLDKDSLELLEFELEKSYFMPEITRIDIIEEDEGSCRWRVDTNKGLREFKVGSRVHDIRKLSDSLIIIKDTDGNRFKLPNLNRLDQKSIAILLKQL